MRDKDLQVIEIALTCDMHVSVAAVRWQAGERLTIITPRPSKNLLDIWMTALLLSYHLDGLRGPALGKDRVEE